MDFQKGPDGKYRYLGEWGEDPVKWDEIYDSFITQTKEKVTLLSNKCPRLYRDIQQTIKSLKKGEGFKSEVGTVRYDDVPAKIYKILDDQEKAYKLTNEVGRKGVMWEERGEPDMYMFTIEMHVVNGFSFAPMFRRYEVPGKELFSNFSRFSLINLIKATKNTDGLKSDVFAFMYATIQKMGEKREHLIAFEDKGRTGKYVNQYLGTIKPDNAVFTLENYTFKKTGSLQPLLDKYNSAPPKRPSRDRS
jgi:hypothetical protein